MLVLSASDMPAMLHDIDMKSLICHYEVNVYSSLLSAEVHLLLSALIIFIISLFMPRGFLKTLKSVKEKFTADDRKE